MGKMGKGEYYAVDWQGLDPKAIHYDEQLNKDCMDRNRIGAKMITLRLVPGGSEEYKRWGNLTIPLEDWDRAEYEVWVDLDDPILQPLGIFTKDRRIRWRSNHVLDAAQTAMWMQAIANKIVLDVRFDQWNMMTLQRPDSAVGDTPRITLVSYHDRQHLQMFSEKKAPTTTSQLLPVLDRIIHLATA